MAKCAPGRARGGGRTWAPNTGFLSQQLTKAGIEPEECAPEHLRVRSSVQDSDAIDLRISELEQELVQLNASQEVLDKTYVELSELRYVLREADIIFRVCGRSFPLPPRTHTHTHTARADTYRDSLADARSRPGRRVPTRGAAHVQDASVQNGSPGGAFADDVNLLDAADGGHDGRQIGYPTRCPPVARGAQHVPCVTHGTAPESVVVRLSRSQRAERCDPA